jgi:hypothetical protein
MGPPSRGAIDLYPRRSRKACPPRQRIDVLLFPGGDQERLPLSRKLRKLLHPRPHERADEGLSVPLVDKRLYLPEGIRSQAGIRATVQDMYALLCIYLVQEAFVKLDENRGVLEFLETYLHQFNGATQIGIHFALAEILAHYQIPQDYRAVRKYVAKTITGLRANQRRREGWGTPQPRDAVPAEDLAQSDCPDATFPGALMIPEAAAELGISVRSLYDYQKRGKVRTEEVVIGSRRFLGIPMDEIARLKASCVRKHVRKVLIEARAARTGSQKASARRWVERQETLGLGLEAIGQRLREMPTAGENIDETEG